jgi:hypothetical protein
MLATQLNDKVESKELDKNVVVKLTHFVLNAVQGRKCVCRPRTCMVRDGEQTADGIPQIDHHPRFERAAVERREDR